MAWLLRRPPRPTVFCCGLCVRVHGRRLCEFPLTSNVSLDQRLRELVASLQPVTAPLAEKQEHLALLARWHYSTWSDGEWIGFHDPAQTPYRKLVRAISRVGQKGVEKEVS